jgi:ABC-type polysaccharide/polyol phosphate transport system ATPase subunit
MISPAIFGNRPRELQQLVEHEFWAVDNVSFELARGEAVGVIGLNGSGKTTLLRMLAGQILPDRGQIWIGGSSAAMIDLQAGFQRNATGRENIFLRSAALGFSKAETQSRLAEIIDFSELGDAIDAPMASYSSGMKMRLAFAVMATVSPDVLFIDEILAVGDFRFRQKCLAKIREMRRRSAFVFVSHSMGDVERFCDRVIVLHKGRMHFMGEPRAAIEIYETLDDSANGSKTPTNVKKAMGPTFANAEALTNVAHFWCDAEGNKVEETSFSETLRLAIRFRSNIDIRNLIIGVPIWNVNAQYATGVSTQITSDKFEVGAGEAVSLMLEIDGSMINPGVIKSVIGIVDGVEYLYRQPNPDLVIKDAPHQTWGVVTVPHRWRRVDHAHHADRAIAHVGRT